MPKKSKADVDIEELTYERCCNGCEYERACHISCETCEFYDEIYHELKELYDIE